MDIGLNRTSRVKSCTAESMSCEIGNVGVNIGGVTAVSSTDSRLVDRQLM